MRFHEDCIHFHASSIISHEDSTISPENTGIFHEKKSFFIKRKPTRLREILFFKKPDRFFCEQGHFPGNPYSFQERGTVSPGNNGRS